MKLRLILLLSFLFIGSLFSGCKKDDKITIENDQFCALVSSKSIEATGLLINDFLAGLENSDKSDNLLKLKTWLEAKSCVDSVSIICNSCIYTYPTQSELSVTFITNGTKSELIMDVIMAEPLIFGSYHN